MEVVATIRFTSPCLGSIRQDPSRKETYDRMPRDPMSGKVIFQQTWWRSSLGYASTALCKYHKEVSLIQTDPLIEGECKIYQRFWTKGSEQHSTNHEAFLAGETITVKFCLPPKLSLDAFKELLTFAGRYSGISPYGYREDWGRFSVDDVRRYDGKTQSAHSPPGKPDPGNPGLARPAGTGTNLHQARQ